MAKFDAEEVVDVTAIKQLISDWTYEVDANGGRGIAEADLLTPDCRCKLLEQWVVGIDAIATFYKQNYAAAEAEGGAPVVRQLVSNFRIVFTGRDEAKADFALLLFAKRGTVPFSDYCEPVEVADVHVSCSRGSDRLWRISRLEGDRIFRRER